MREASPGEPPHSLVWRRRVPHLGLQEAAVGGVRCASSLPLLALALDFWKGTDAAVTGIFLPQDPGCLLCKPRAPPSLPALQPLCPASAPQSGPGRVGAPGIAHSEAGQTCWPQVEGLTGGRVGGTQNPGTCSQQGPVCHPPARGCLSWDPGDSRRPLVRRWPG